MIRKLSAVLLVALFGLSAYAAETKPTEKSIRELLLVTDAQKLSESSMSQIDDFMKTAMQQGLKGRSLTEEQQKQLDRSMAKIVQLYKDEMSWTKLEPMVIRTYQDSFNQQEIDGMLAFYRSPAGQAVIRKMPVVMRNMMGEMQKLMGPMMQKMMEGMKEDLAHMDEAADPKK